MISPGRYDIAADRWVACIRSFTLLGIDLTGAVMVAQVRMTKDVGGAPLVDLPTVATSASEGLRIIYAGTATVAAHIAAGRLSEAPSGYASGDSVALTEIGLRINETTIEGLPFPGSGAAGERGDDVPLEWDAHITPVGGIKDKYFGGKFIVRSGVTQ